MSSDKTAQDDARDEAARWLATLNGASVSTEDLEAFHRWRRDPDHDAAYRRLEAVWTRSGRVEGDPRIAEALASAHRRAKDARVDAHNRWGLLAAVGLTLACVCVLYLGVTAPWSPWGGARYQTAVGEQRTVVLADGTRVHLDTDSRIRVQMGPRQRSVTLERGQAYFNVAHLLNRPFKVAVGAVTIRDVGTSFDVRQEDQHVLVTLVEGEVQVDQTDERGAHWALRPGQQVVVGGGRSVPRTVDPAVATSWTKGRLVFNDMPLASATAEMNRYAAHQIVLASPGLETARVTGTFDTSDAAGFASAVAKLYDLNAKSREDGAIVLSNGEGPKAT